MAALNILGNADVVISTCVGAANEIMVKAASVTCAPSSRSGTVLRSVPRLQCSSTDLSGSYCLR